MTLPRDAEQDADAARVEAAASLTHVLVVCSRGICGSLDDHLEAHGPKPSCAQRLAEPANSQFEELFAELTSCSPSAEVNVPMVAGLAIALDRKEPVLHSADPPAGQRAVAARRGEAPARPEAPPRTRLALTTRGLYALATAASRARRPKARSSWSLHPFLSPLWPLGTASGCACGRSDWFAHLEWSDLRGSLISSICCEKKRVLCERSAVRCAGSNVMESTPALAPAPSLTPAPAAPSQQKTGV